MGFIPRQEKHSSSGWDGGNPAVWQVDRLTSCAPVIFYPLLCQGQIQENPIPTLLPHHSHQPHRNTESSVQSKYKPTGRDAVYIIRGYCVFFFHVESGIINVNNRSYSAENRKHA